MLKNIGYKFALVAALLTAWFAPDYALAQVSNPGVNQQGSVTADNLAVWAKNRFIKDGGTRAQIFSAITNCNIQGGIIFIGASGNVSCLDPTGHNGQFLKSNDAGADPSFATASGGGTVTSIQLTGTSGIVTIGVTSGANPCVAACVLDFDIAANAITNAKFRQSGALSVVGRSANSTGNVADISAVAASDSVLRESGSTLGFGQIVAGGIASNAVITAKILDANVTYAKIQNVTNARLLGNNSGGAAAPSEIALGAGGSLAFPDATHLARAALTGDATASADSNTTTVVKVNGVAYPASPSDDQIPVADSAIGATYRTVPDCTNVQPNSLEYTQSTNTFNCNNNGAFTAPVNLGISVTAGSSALTIALKDAAGNDPTSGSPVLIPFRNATGTTGTPTWLKVSAANSVVVSSGSTLGVVSSTAFRIWIEGCNDAGTFRLGVFNASSAALDSATIFPLSEEQLLSSTAEGGAGAADSAGVLYTGTAISSKACRIIAYAEWSASGLTAGTWTTTNLLYVQLFGPGIHKPGDVIQTISPTVASTGADFSTTSATYVFATGNSQSITPQSAANIIRVTMKSSGDNSAAARSLNCRISRGTTAATNLFGTITSVFGSASQVTADISIFGYDKPNTTSSQAYGVQLRSVLGGSVTFYGPTSGGVFWNLEEIMG